MDFHAKLRRPKPEYWLGLEVESQEVRQSHISGNLYLLVKFKNCPFWMSLGAHQANALMRICREREIKFAGLEELLAPGKRFNASCKWQPYRDDTNRFGPMLQPDYLSLLGLES